jgi:hypothetical protein
MQKASTVILSAGLLLTGFLGACANANQDITKNEITPDKVSTDNQSNTDNQGKHLGWQNENNPHYVAPKTKEQIVEEYIEQEFGEEVISVEHTLYEGRDSVVIHFVDYTYHYPDPDTTLMDKTYDKVNQVYGIRFDMTTYGKPNYLIYSVYAPIAPIDPFEEATKQMVSYIESKGITVSKTYQETNEGVYQGTPINATVIYAETDRHMTTQEMIEFQTYCQNNIENWRFAHQFYSGGTGKQIAITIF